MQKLFVLCTVMLCLNHNLFAQLEGSVSTGLGYGYNIFRAPDFYLNSNNEEIEADSLIQQGVFGFAKTALQYEIGNRDKKLLLKADGLRHQYPLENSLQKTNYGASATFRKRFKKKHYLYLQAYYRVNSQIGTNFSEDLFNIPLSYKKLGGYAELRLKLNKKYKLYTKIETLSKNYFDDTPETFAYTALNGAVTLKRYLKKRKDFQNRLEVEMGTSQRAYEKVKVLNTAEDLDTTFFWNRSIFYLETSAFVGLTKQLSYNTTLRIRRQTETRSRGLFYTAYTMQHTLKYQNDRWLLDLSPEVELRKYFPDDNQEETEQNTRTYTYLKGNISLSYQLKDHWLLVLNGRFKKRISSVDEETNLFFRSYKTFTTSIGLRYQF